MKNQQSDVRIIDARISTLQTGKCLTLVDSKWNRVLTYDAEKNPPTITINHVEGHNSLAFPLTEDQAKTFLLHLQRHGYNTPQGELPINNSHHSFLFFLLPEVQKLTAAFSLSAPKLALKPLYTVWHSKL